MRSQRAEPHSTAPAVCICPCHGPGRVVHPVPCCHSCPHCHQQVTVGFFESHVRCCQHESALIAAFVAPTKRSRLRSLLRLPRRRRQVLEQLAHFRSLDPRWVVPIASSDQHANRIEAILRSRGAPESCYVVSENTALDGQELKLGDAISQVVGLGMGTLISCIPSRLAYFEGEGPSDRCLLQRSAA